MTILTRHAATSDLDAVADLLLQDAEERHALDPGLWRLAADPCDKIKTSPKSKMQAEEVTGYRRAITWYIREA